MRRTVALLLVLIGLAVLAVGLLQPFRHNCGALKREAVAGMAAMEICAQQLACHYDYSDLLTVTQLHQAYLQCQAREEDR